ncbi:MAG: glycerophosphodiester phosphodiesterase family protein [Gammaproteobacteria bacterium]
MHFYSNYRPRFRLIGHRGVASLAPENTLAGFQLVKVLGLNWVEFDIQLTRDLEWVVFHDDTLNRTSTGHGAIYEHLFADLKSLDAGSWFHPGFKNEKIPHFQQVIELLNETGLIPNIEIKIAAGCPFLPETFGRKLLEFLKTDWPAHKSLPLISSFEHKTLNWLRNHAPEYPLGFLFENINPKEIEQISTLNNISIHFHANEHTDLEYIKKLANQHPLIPYTVNEVSLGHQLLEAGCFALFTDCPQKFIASTI